jgi:chromate transporter
MTLVPLSLITRSFARIGLLSFGGPAAQIALMHRELVEDRRWLTESQFLRALSFCMLLPGPEAMQLATYAGWKLRGTPGGLIAGALFVLPGACVIAALALAYAHWGTQPATAALLLGVKATVIAIVAQALWRLSRKALRGRADIILAIAAFAALWGLKLPFPLVIVLAALWGAWQARKTPAPHPLDRSDTARPDLATQTRTALIWTLLWLAPLPLLWLADQSLLFDLATFFAKLAVVTFGGAYAVLAYMAQEVVQTRGWLSPDAMVDALGLAETTPGPLILVTQFVGMLTGAAAGGPALALVAGVLVLWMTFVPCFLWIFVAAPHVEGLLSRPRLQGALAAISAAVVGVIANLSLWFALHVLFGTVTTRSLGPLSLDLPRLASLDMTALGLTCLAAGLLIGLNRSVPFVLLVCAATGAAVGGPFA